ncbi:hypothetical protein SAMN05421837_101283 [Amycolatopsis pretoriensis]|uniref:Uncharacterized protein n=1 Tax=Amycolatopsis pretoriensis TaxID=218821 RepID=A0A1H5Q2F8_9PSEU|nr:hypothetical protein [Amycolatopsis pretoriensis]SEF20236.1 hypothetical protein SAMN05421837_101283 [Amycolatopsis pretoriensis]
MVNRIFAELFPGTPVFHMVNASPPALAVEDGEALDQLPGVTGVFDTPFPPVAVLDAPITFGFFRETQSLWFVELIPQPAAFVTV